MGGTKSKPAPAPARSPSPPQKLANQFSSVSYTNYSSPASASSSNLYPTLPKVTSSTSFQRLSSSTASTRVNTSVSVDPVIPAIVSVVHPVNDYKIPNVKIENDSRPGFNLQLNNSFNRQNNLKIERYVTMICPQHLSRKGCRIQYCFRFHVCQFWVLGNCKKDRCELDHGFNGMTNRFLFEVLQSKRFDEPQMLIALKRNMFRGKELIREDDLTICSENILNRCKKENCRYYHFKTPFVWQVNINNNWVEFPLTLNGKVESFYTEPSNTKCSVSFQKKGGRNGPWVNPIFLSNSIEVDFDKMTMTSKGANHNIRRLSTESDVKKFFGLVTRWLWYWEDEFGCWNFYSNAILKDTGMAVIPFSDYLETEYLKHGNLVLFKFSNDFTYDINFSTMMQTNQITSTKRRIRRRPMPSKEKPSWNENTTIKSLWSITNESSKKFFRTSVAPQSPEYSYFRRMIEKTLHVQHFTLERVENIFLWKTYQIKKAQMLSSYSNNANALSEQYLFHGTSKSVVDKICEQNLDWRLYGTNVGNVYGKGTYFSSSAALSDNYALCDENGFKWMFIILVLVGKACTGNKDIVIPPINPSTKMRFDSTVESAINPTIFVKYNLDDYYPVYIVKYSSSSF